MSAHPNLPDNLRFRKGKADDWPVISGIVEKTWDGHDYIVDQLWATWVVDQTGNLSVVEIDGIIVAFGKITNLGPSEWWLEGLRVAPEYRGQGIARAMMGHHLSWFRKYGDGLLRFATYSKNEATTKLSTEYGFRHRLSFANMRALAEPARFTNFKILQGHNAPMVFEYLKRSPMYRLNHYVEHHWKLYYLTRDRIKKYFEVDNIEVLGWRQDNALTGLCVLYKGLPDGNEPDSNMLYVGYLDALDDTTLQSMLKALRGLATNFGNPTIGWKMPSGFGLDRVLAHAGYRDEWEGDGQLWLFELPLTRQ